MNEHPFSGGSLPSPNLGPRPGLQTTRRSLFRPATSDLPPLDIVLRRLRAAARDEGSSSFGAGVESPSGAASAADGKSGTRRRKRSGSRQSTAPRAAADEPKADSGATTDSKRPRRRGGRGRKRVGRPTNEGAAAPVASGGDGPAQESERPASAGKRPTRRRRRGASAATSSAAGNGSESSDQAGSRSQTGTKSLARKRTGAESTAGTADDRGAAAKRSGRKRGTRGGRRRRKVGAAVGIEAIPGEDDELPELAELPADAVLLKEERPARSRRRTRGGAGQRTDGDETAQARSSRVRPAVAAAQKSTILVNACDPEEVRVVVVKQGQITDLQMTVNKHSSFVSDIYRGRVVNLEPAIGAAFVDFGQGRNGFLHASDVLPCYGEPDWRLDQLLTTPVGGDWDTDDSAESAEPAKSKSKARSKGRTRRPRTPIEKLVKKGQLVAVQITKDAIGDKGPTLTTYISIPGRYLVLMPSLERTGVSRKIDDDKERRRLKRILSALNIPEGMGVIVRTAGIGKTKAEIKRDLDYLLLAWKDFSRRLVSGRNPAPLYQESDVAVRTMRDLFTADTEKVLVDDVEVHARMLEFTEKLMPEHLDRIHLHDGPRPLFHSHAIEQDFEKIFARRVDLPSGGSIVIDQTEALVAIDVNSGRTREAGAEFEDIALKANLEAVEEISRQIRLRDLGGIIVLDYIDMMRASSRRAVEQATRDAFKDDRARSKIGRISQFGLLELTRQRLGPGLARLVYETCLRCRGSGRQRNASSRAQAILRRLGSSLVLKGFTSVEVRAHPEVVDYLQDHLTSELARLERESGRTLLLEGVADQVEDSIFHYLRADGREVRPGGRRKR